MGAQAKKWLLAWVMMALAGTLSAATVSTAYYDLSFLNLNGPEGNVQFFIQLKPNVEKALVRLERGTDAMVARLEFNIEARRPRRGQVVHSWRFRENIRQAAGASAEGLTRVFPLRLDPGDYEFHVELVDLDAGRRFFEVLRFECRPVDAAVLLSDLQLETVKAFGPVSLLQPLYGMQIESQPDSLRFSYTVSCDAPALLTARAVLYRQQEAAPAQRGDADKWQVQHFRTYLQQIEILRLPRGQNVVQGGFNLLDALDGAYQLELTLYRDDVRVAQSSRSFVLEWPRLREVFADLEQAIGWMRWIASPAEQARLLGIEDADEQQREFVAWWQQRCVPGTGDAKRAMKQYFSRVFHAQQAFAGEAHGWDTERGRHYILYGQPDWEGEIPIPGMKLSAWVYRSWNMAFLFGEIDGQMRLLKV